MIRKISNFIDYRDSLKREKKKETGRSPRWSSVRDKFLKKNGECAACGCKTRLQVHHIVPFNEKPELELEESNLLVLCMGAELCHLKLGHGGDYDYWNPDVLEDAKTVKFDITTASLVRMRAKKMRKPNDPKID